MTEAEFRKKNQRRGELILKMHSGFSKEEMHRKFDDHPGWKEESEAREKGNLTDEEREELARLQEEVGDYIEQKYPIDFSHLDKLAKRAERIAKKLKQMKVYAPILYYVYRSIS